MLPLFGGGCGIQGKWALERIDPESARGEFRLAEVTLDRDGTYTATSRYDKTEKISRGTYEYRDKTLTFSDADGQKHIYQADLLDWGAHLCVKRMFHGQEVIAVMKRQ